MEFIDYDLAKLGRFHARHLQIDIVRRRRATNRPNQAVYGIKSTICGTQSQATVVIFNNFSEHGVGMQLNAVLLHLYQQSLHNGVIKRAQRRVLTDIQVYLSAETIHHTSDLNGDISRSNDSDPFWQMI